MEELNNSRLRDIIEKHKDARKRAQVNAGPNKPISINEKVLLKIDIRDEDLSGIIFNGSEFKECTLINCIFDRVNFAHSTFEECEFKACNFRKTDLTQTKHYVSKFLGCNFSKTDFSDSDLSEADFTGSSFSACDFYDANLKNVIFKEIIISECVLKNSNLYNEKKYNVDFESPGKNKLIDNFFSIDFSRLNPLSEEDIKKRLML